MDVPTVADVAARQLTLHYSRRLDAIGWQARHERGDVPDRWPYGLDRLAEAYTVRPFQSRHSLPRRALRAAGGGYEWDRLTDRAEAAVCWDERTGVPVALSGVPTLTGVIWLTEHDHRHWSDRLARRALARSTVFVNSPLQLVDLTDRWGVPASRAHFVPFGIDQEFWRPSAGERRGVLIIGNDRHRDHPTALRAARGTGHRVTLVTRQHLPAQRVASMSHPELRQAYADHAVVALATGENRHASGLTVALEAMASARPVVATRGGGLEEYITEDVGILVARGDHAAMSSALSVLLADPERAVEMGSAGRRAVEERFNTRALAQHLANLARTL